jgi:hypothetical protein
VPLTNAEVVLQLSCGKRLLAFVLPDGSFSFADVPLGLHTLSVQLPGLLYPTVKLDVGTTSKGKVAASAADVPGVSGRCVNAPGAQASPPCPCIPLQACDRPLCIAGAAPGVPAAAAALLADRVL